MNGTTLQSVVFREGALAELGSILDQLTARRILFVVDSTAYSASGAADHLKDCLNARETATFSEFEINPKVEDVRRGIVMYEQFRPDVVVGLGGGTAIDLTKMIGRLGGQPADVSELITGGAPIVPNEIPLVVIPTTSGTGSEATHFAVVYQRGEKFSVAHPGLLPSVVILDPVLTYSVPGPITAATGLDALCQAIESIWAAGATDESVEYASRSLRLALANLEAAVYAPNPNVRRAMCEAAHLAGKAINISKTTAPHALSYWLTTHYGVPHGVAVALFVGRLLVYNAQVSISDCNDPRGPDHVQRRIATILALLEVKDTTSGGKKLDDLIRKLGCPVTLRDVGVGNNSDVLRLCEKANAERLTNNPRKLSTKQLFDLLREQD